jgi:hypothetical protein
MNPERSIHYHSESEQFSLNIPEVSAFPLAFIVLKSSAKQITAPQAMIDSIICAKEKNHAALCYEMVAFSEARRINMSQKGHEGGSGQPREKRLRACISYAPEHAFGT